MAILFQEPLLNVLLKQINQIYTFLKKSFLITLDLVFIILFELLMQH